MLAPENFAEKLRAGRAISEQACRSRGNETLIDGF
jgi:hypothetical protein